MLLPPLACRAVLAGGAPGGDARGGGGLGWAAPYPQRKRGWRQRCTLLLLMRHTPLPRCRLQVDLTGEEVQAAFDLLDTGGWEAAA